MILAGREVRVSDQTRQRVLRAARELGYRPNLTARSLRTQVSSTIGLVADTIITGHYGGEMVRGSLTAALRHGHRLLICEYEGDPELEPLLIEDLVARQVDGLLYTTASHDRVDLPAALDGQRVVLLNCESDSAWPSVVPDEVEGGRAAARLLVEAGHSRRHRGAGGDPVRQRAGLAAVRGHHRRARRGRHRGRRPARVPGWPEAAYDAVSAALAAGCGRRPSSASTTASRSAPTRRSRRPASASPTTSR